MDGASGQQRLKLTGNDDSSIFMTMIVPLQAVSRSVIVRQNKKPCSTRLCRPVAFEFKKETFEYTTDIYKFYSSEIENLNETVIENVNNVSCQIKHTFQCSMIDGKTCNTLSNQPNTRSCNVCHATTKQMNDWTILKTLKCNTLVYDFGISPLHCKIRFMETVLHISYNMEFKKSI